MAKKLIQVIEGLGEHCNKKVKYYQDIEIELGLYKLYIDGAYVCCYPFDCADDSIQETAGQIMNNPNYYIKWTKRQEIKFRRDMKAIKLNSI